MHCEKKQTMQRCNIWQFIYKKKELQSDVKRCKRGRQNGNISAKWQNWLKAHLSSWGISSPRGFTHRKSRTSSKFGTCKSQTWLSSTNRSIDWEKRNISVFTFSPRWEYHSCFTHMHNVPVVQKSILMCQGLSIFLSLDTAHHCVSAVFFSTKRCNLPMSLLSFWLHLPWFLSRLVS